jgi:hypothetical protein
MMQRAVAVAIIVVLRPVVWAVHKWDRALW